MFKVVVFGQQLYESIPCRQWVRDCTDRPVSPVGMYRSRGLSQRIESRMSSVGVRSETARVASLLSISEREVRLDRQSVSLLGPGRQRCDFFSNPLFCSLTIEKLGAKWCSIYIFR